MATATQENTTQEQVRDEVSDLKRLLADAEARKYINAMKAGKKPDERPEVGEFWDDLVSELERKYTKFGNIPTGVLDDMCRQYPALADLLKLPMQGVKVESVNDLGFFPPLPASAQLPPELSRDACPWLDRFVAYSKEASPEAYDDIHQFCGLWALSGISNRRIYLPQGEEDINLYTNLMIQYCGKSTFFAKSHTARVAQSVLKRAGLDFFVFSDMRMTPQKLLLEMTGQIDLESYLTLTATEQEEIKQKVAFAGQKVMYYDEYGTMLEEVLGGKNPTMAVYEQLFLSLYNCPPKYSNATILRGMPPVKDPFLTILGSMTPSNLRTIAKTGAKSWETGLFGRNIFLAPSKEDVKNSTLKFKSRSVPSNLISPLQAWHKDLGCPKVDISIETQGEGEKKKERLVITQLKPLPSQQCRIDDNVEEAFDRYRTAIRQLASNATIPEDLVASYGRLPENAMKFAMIMASLSNDNHIEMRHWAKAQELAEVARYNLHKLYAQVNTPDGTPTREAEIEERIIAILKKYGAMTLNILRRDHLKKYSVKQLKTALNGMKQAGMVTEFSTSHSVKWKLIEE